MSTSQQLTVYKSYPTEITIKADGYYDYKTTKTFTTAGETVNIPSTEMTVYDGLDCSFSTASNNLYLADFSDTTLPNGNTPSPTLYAMKASGQTYPIPSAPVYDNYTIVGSPTVNTSTGVVSGFSSSSYLTLPQSFNPGNNPWKIVSRIQSNSSSAFFMGGSKSNLSFVIGSWNGILTLWLSSNGSDFDIAQEEQTYMKSCPSGYFYFKLSFSGTKYSLEISTDKINWEKAVEVSTSSFIHPSDIYLGNCYDFNNNFAVNGSIDLSETYINVNNSIWWEANSSPDVQIEGCLVNYTDDGSAVTLNAYQTGTSIILTPDVSYNGIKLGTVNVPSHSV